MEARLVEQPLTPPTSSPTNATLHLQASTKMATTPTLPARSKTKPSKPYREPFPYDADHIFQEGFLDRVYNERPVKNALTRFPPEPNGYLHIGHCKALAINFGFAKFNKGDCCLRLDDTDPKGEEEVYVKSIEDLVHWLGFKPFKVTHSSDYFDQLYELAEALILKDRAYVCHCTGRQDSS